MSKTPFARHVSSTRTPVVIIGAGLTGMSASLHLRASGTQHRIIERSHEPGGLSVTVERDGFRFDRTGHLLHLRDPEIRESVLGLPGCEFITINRCSMVWSQGRFTRYPYQANTYGLPPETAFECVMGFLEAQHQARQENAEHTTANFEQFCMKHFGRGFCEHFMIPYNHKLWGVHPREITALWCRRFVPIPTVQDVIGGAVGYSPRELGYNTSFVYPSHGIGSFSNALAQSVGIIELNKEVCAIDATLKRIELIDGECVDYNVLITTAPLTVLMGMMKNLPGSVREAATRLRYTCLHYLDVALDVPSKHPFHWVYVPEERYPFYRVGVYSNFSPKMAPNGKACMYIELTDRREPDIPGITAIVADSLVELGFIDRRDQMLFADHRTIDHAYVIYDHAYQASVSTLMEYLTQMGIISVGRYGGWDYSSMEDAILYGRRAAKEAMEILR